MRVRSETLYGGWEGMAVWESTIVVVTIRTSLHIPRSAGSKPMYPCQTHIVFFSRRKTDRVLLRSRTAKHSINAAYTALRALHCEPLAAFI